MPIFGQFSVIQCAKIKIKKKDQEENKTAVISIVKRVNF